MWGDATTKWTGDYEEGIALVKHAGTTDDIDAKFVKSGDWSRETQSGPRIGTGGDAEFNTSKMGRMDDVLMLAALHAMFQFIFPYIKVPGALTLWAHPRVETSQS